MVRPNNGAVDHVDFPVDLTVLIAVFLNLGKQLSPQALSLPAVEAGTHRLPVTVALREIAPGRSGPLEPEDAVEDGAVIQRGATRPRSLRWEQWSQLAPLLISQLITPNHASFLHCLQGLRTHPSSAGGLRTKPPAASPLARKAALLFGGFV